MEKRIVVNGTFDILHRGHLELLNFAKKQGDWLLVCIDSDRRVKELKGETRPVNSEADRKFMLQNLKAVDYVLIFDSSEELEEILESYRPDAPRASISTNTICPGRAYIKMLVAVVTPSDRPLAWPKAPNPIMPASKTAAGTPRASRHPAKNAWRRV